jgi:hypothetical protein
MNNTTTTEGAQGAWPLSKSVHFGQEKCRELCEKALAEVNLLRKECEMSYQAYDQSIRALNDQAYELGYQIAHLQEKLLRFVADLKQQ